MLIFMQNPEIIYPIEIKNKKQAMCLNQSSNSKVYIKIHPRDCYRRQDLLKHYFSEAVHSCLLEKTFVLKCRFNLEYKLIEVRTYTKNIQLLLILLPSQFMSFFSSMYVVVQHFLLLFTPQGVTMEKVLHT